MGNKLLTVTRANVINVKTLITRRASEVTSCLCTEMNEQVHCEFLTFLQKGPGRWKVSAPLWVPWKCSGLWLRPRLLFPKFFSWALVLIDPMNVRTKFKVRSFTCSWDNRGYPKIWAVPGHAHAPFSPKFLIGVSSDVSCNCICQIWSPYLYLFLSW